MTPPIVDLSALGTQMETLVKTAAQDYIKGNSGTLAQLGGNFNSDLLKAIFGTTVLAQLPPIGPLDPDADADHIAAVEATLDARDEQLALIATAEQQNAALVAKLKSNAMAVLGGLMNTIFGLVGSVATKGIAAL